MTRVFGYLTAIWLVQAMVAIVPIETHGSRSTASPATDSVRLARNPAILRERIVYSGFERSRDQSGLSAAFWAWSATFPARLDRAMATGAAE